MTREPMNKQTVKAELGRNPSLGVVADELLRIQPKATLFDLVDEISLKIDQQKGEASELEKLLADAEALKAKYGESLVLDDDSTRPNDPRG
ncbi:MAG: hypothetical protein K8U03_07790 [Planctomycetia bacterium]|nr:hypothetical protein [Planctomycetia bacterium]